jgi:hypothetical protein
MREKAAHAAAVAHAARPLPSVESLTVWVELYSLHLDCEFELDALTLSACCCIL